MGKNTLFRWGLFLTLSIGISPLAAEKWFSFSASDFIKDPRKSGFRKAILAIPMHQKGSFHRFLELYDDTPSPAEKMKIMRSYYKNHCEDAFELLALIYFFHAFDPLNPLCEKILFRFLKDHHFQKNVTAVFFASYSTFSSKRAKSFIYLLARIYERCPELTMPNLATLHFVDLMMSQEGHSMPPEKLRANFIKLWRREIPTNILNRGIAQEWIRKVLAFYELRQFSMPVFTMGVRDFLRGRRRFFERYGYDSEQIVEAFWDQFIIPSSAYEIPKFLPAVERGF